MGDRVVLILHPGSTVDQITLRGLEHTRPGIILREFEVLQGLKSIEDIHRSLELIHGNLMSLGVFEAVDILLDESAKVRGTLKLDWVGNTLSNEFDFRRMGIGFRFQSQQQKVQWLV